MLNGTIEQADLYIVFPAKKVSQYMTDHQCPTRTHSINKQRMWPIKRIDESSIFNGCPAHRLNSTCSLQCQFIKIPLPRIIWYFIFLHESQQVSVCTYVVKSMVVHAFV